MKYIKTVTLVGFLLTWGAFAQTGTKKPVTGQVKMNNDQFNSQPEKCKVGAVVAPVGSNTTNKKTSGQSASGKAQ